MVKNFRRRYPDLSVPHLSIWKVKVFANDNDHEFGILSVLEKMSRSKDLTLSELVSTNNEEDEAGKKGEMAAVEVDEKDGGTARCGFCHKGVLPKPLEGGKLYRVGSLICHYFCMLFTFNSKQLGEDNEGLFGFSLAEVSNHMELGAKRRCKYCHLAGATARCDKKHCGLWMHFPCGQEKGATFQFNGRMMIYCTQHRLRQKVVIIVC